MSFAKLGPIAPVLLLLEHISFFSSAKRRYACSPVAFNPIPIAVFLNLIKEKQ
jgi:hypothetical protein